MKIKFMKIVIVLLSVFVLLGSTTVYAAAGDKKMKTAESKDVLKTQQQEKNKNTQSNSKVVQSAQLDVQIEVQKGKKWVDLSTTEIKLKSKKEKKEYNYELPALRVVNNEDYAVEVSVSVVKDTSASWLYTDEKENVDLDNFSTVIESNNVSESFSISGTSDTKVSDVELVVSAQKVREPYYTINTDVDLNIDEEGKTIVLDDDVQNYLASVNGQKITLSNVTITGHTEAVMLGQYRSPSYCTFNNELNNVTIKDLEVTNGVYNHKDTVSNGVYTYGNTVLNDCVMTGTTSTAEGFNVYDIGFVNKSVSTINGGTYGAIYVWSQAHLTINNAQVDKIDCSTITTRNLGMLTIGAGTHVGTILLTTAGYSQYKPALTIEKGATVDKIIYNGKTYTQYEWNSPFYGKTISIMGDSISTYHGYSDVNPITSEDCKYRYGEAYYGPAGGDFHNTDLLVSDTWWYQAAHQLGAEVLVSNAGNSTALLHASYPSIPEWQNYLQDMLMYKSRPYYLGTAEKDPDIIALYVGSADVGKGVANGKFGSLEAVDFDTLIVENEDGTYTYATPQTVAEAYCILLHKIKVTYPNAEVYCFSVLPNAGGTTKTINTRLKANVPFNKMVKDVADYYGAYLVDIYDEFNIDPDGDGVAVDEDVERFKSYFHNDPHPNASGFDVITKRFVETVLENSKYNK